MSTVVDRIAPTEPSIGPVCRFGRSSWAVGGPLRPRLSVPPHNMGGPIRPPDTPDPSKGVLGLSKPGFEGAQWCEGSAVADRLVVRGAREHNLRSVDLDLPRDSLIVFTGLSGSGKSSLAFDTIFAEGQRRYVESLSAYARQFLGQMDKPDV